MKPFAQQTYYEILEVPPTASDAEIRAAHQRLMELYSPDSIAVYALGDPDQVEALRAQMTEAMEMLTDADLRVEYDRSIGLSTDQLAKAAAAVGAPDKVDSATRVAEALATAAAALAKAAGAVDAERLEAESRLKAASSVNEDAVEAPRASGTPGKSEDRMRGEESKRQESSGMDAPGAAPEPVMVGGVAVVEAFRASFTRSLSFVYVPAGPLRGQGRGAVTEGLGASPGPTVEAKESVAAEPASEAASASRPAAAPAEAATVAPPDPAPKSGEAASGGGTSAASAPDSQGPSANTAGASAVEQSSATASAPSRAEQDAAPAPSAGADLTALASGEHAGASVEAAAPASVASTSDGAVAPGVDAPKVATAVSDREPTPEAGAPDRAEAASSEASSVSPEAGAASPLAPAVPDEAARTAAVDSASVATTTQGESSPNPAPTPDATPSALARTPATGASRAAVRPLTSRPIDSRPATGPGASKSPTVRKLGDAQVLAQDSAIATAESALAQVAAKVREARPRGVDIPADAEFNGELLRRVREARGLSIQQLADRTRISVRHLENVEADRYTALPTTVYLRGILMNLARELGLDPLRVSKSYLALFSEKPARSGR
ncbi:helix-turn-helix domain-containing protein [Corallococcus sp. Z5C101001]|uniref:helix-turn-helix domain-containing protein n=1 Tax=Corallococcus sp. Z5C101001 TaxID=2596829 RepID=UPI00117D1982|nr:helix-turn-helix domain-containing protein [Corallococcus sp. Z5C101001]TSC21482.1 helix-turn-helix domain-containing protein [Corallococcus sp. Z5C101001]